MLHITGSLPPLAGPAALVRTISQDPTKLSANHLSCGTSAARDVASTSDARDASGVLVEGLPPDAGGVFTVTVSTWDSAEYETIRDDPRRHNCVVLRRAGGRGGGAGATHAQAVGTAASGTPCAFPFRYKGQLFFACTSQDWTARWCATTPVYNGSWGECVCAPLRRGVSASMAVRMDTQGPMYTLHAKALQELLSPLVARGGGDADGGGGGDIAEALEKVNGTMDVFYPVFDEHLQGALELRVNFVPAQALACASPPPPPPVPDSHASAAASYPTGHCERLGLITESVGDGDAAQEVCVTADDHFLAEPEATTLAEMLITAATSPAVPGAGGHALPAPPPLVSQACKDHDPPLMRQLSLCAAEAMHHPQHLRRSWVADESVRQEHLLHPHPSARHQHRQQCFWTDTSTRAQQSLPDSSALALACSVCDPSGYSCTSVHEPLRGWTVAVASDATSTDGTASGLAGVHGHEAEVDYSEMCAQNTGNVQPQASICRQLHAT